MTGRMTAGARCLMRSNDTVTGAEAQEERGAYRVSGVRHDPSSRVESLGEASPAGALTTRGVSTA